MVVGLGLLALTPLGLAAQAPFTSVIPGTKVGGSSNLHVLSHIPIGRSFSGSDMEIEQELSRPYAYTSVMLQTGTNIISLKDPNKAFILLEWRAPNAALHAGTGAMDNKYFKLKNRYYDVQSLQFGQQGPDADIGAHVIDVTGLPDTNSVKDKGYIRYPDAPGGFHNMYAYKHSDGRVLLFTTVTAQHANVYDMEKFLAGDPKFGLVGQVPIPDMPNARQRGYHDFYLGYDPANHRDVFYGAGAGGYHVYDVTDINNPKLLTSITGVAGVTGGHTFTPDPTGRYVVTESEYTYAPLRMFDLKPGLDGTVKAISRPIGAWTADWHDLSHNHEVRWPYVFVSAYEDGLQVFNMMDPTNPYTVGYYYTCDCPHSHGWGGVNDPDSGTNVENGAFGIDVRNADGLIVIEDFRTGFWAFRMDGFDGWNGHQWGMPNVSSVQDWDHGPEGVPQRVSLR
jgi:hypothetical protein